MRKRTTRARPSEDAGLLLRRDHGPAVVAVLVVGTLLSGLAAASVVRFDRERDTGNLQRETAIMASRMEATTAQTRNALESLRPLWAFTVDPTRAQFQQFLDNGIRELAEDQTAEYGGLRSVGFIRAVAPGEVADFLARRRAERPGSYGWNLTDQTAHYVLDYSVSSDELLGVDFYPLPLRRAALEAAGDSGDATATAWFDHVADRGKPENRRRQVSLLYVPVYTGGRVPNSVDARQRALVGWLASATTADALLGNASADLAVSATLYDGTPADATRVATLGEPVPDGPREAFTVETAGRVWTAIVTQRAGSQPAALIGPWHVLVIGLVITALLSSLSRRRAQAEERATTATKQMQISNRSLRALAEHVPVGILDLGVDCHVHWVNSRALELLGEDATDESDVTDLALFVHPDDRLRVTTAYRHSFETAEPLHLRHRIVTRDGETRWIEQRGTPIIDAEGHLVRMVVSINDISGLVEFEQQLTRARDGALEASSMKSEFLANMSHEIRTPLNGVIGMANLLLDGALDAGQRSRVVTLRTAANQLLVLLNDILDLSKIEAGHMQLETVNFDPREVVGDALRLHASGARDKGIEFFSDVDDDLPAIMCGDPVRIRQVLDNLLSNAIKFTSDGEVRLGATAERRGQRRALLRFAVRDTGVGISQGAQEAIFHPFTQADTSTTRRFGGTGLGLSICRQLAELMGGTLSIESTEREGSCFEFAVMLPVGRWERTADPTTDDGDDNAESGDRLDSALRLLLVEDNMINQEVALGLLGSKGWQIDVANNGVEGVDAVETANADGAPYDAILMDCQMPQMDGYEATGHIRRMEGERRHTPVIALTAAVMKGDRERCIAAGMDDYIPKPISVATLEAVLRRQLGDGAQRPAALEVETAGLDDEPPVIDWQILHDLAAVDGLLARSSERYLEYSPMELSALRAAVSQRDFAQARAMAHKLKGASATLGMARLAAALAIVERACRQAPDTVADLLVGIDEAFAEASEALTAAAAQLDTAPAGDRG